MINKHHLVIAALVGASMVLLAKSTFIQAKAHVAEWMIANTWEERPLNGAPQKPWPWADTWVVAQITIPHLGIKQYVMQDASGESLAFGPGAVIPVSTDHYNFIAGHRDTHFSYLDKLNQGDLVQVETYQGHMQTYQIKMTQVVDTRDGPFYVDEQSSGMSLMTCWPMDSMIPGGPLRYVVSGDVYDF